MDVSAIKDPRSGQPFIKALDIKWLSCKEATEDAVYLEKKEFEKVKHNMHADVMAGVLPKICPSAESAASSFGEIAIFFSFIVSAMHLQFF